jgi:DNA-binding response OmpR family regulator
MGMNDAARILIVEDETLIAMDLEAIVSELISASISVHPTIASALRAIDEELVSFAFLDVNLVDGKSYPLARRLLACGVPFVLVSAHQEDLPPDLQAVGYVRKPFNVTEISQALATLG